MITLFPPFLPGIVPHKRYGILQLADYEPSGTTSSIASPKPLGISKPFHRVQNMRDCCTGDSLANNAPVFVKLPFLVTWTFGVMGGRQSSVRTAFWTSRPQRLIYSSSNFFRCSGLIPLGILTLDFRSENKPSSALLVFRSPVSDGHRKSIIAAYFVLH